MYKAVAAKAAAAKTNEESGQGSGSGGVKGVKAPPDFAAHGPLEQLALQLRAYQEAEADYNGGL